MARPSTPGRRRGFALIAMLIVVAGMGAALAVAGTVWRDANRRALEKELMFVGLEYRRAIARYVAASPTGSYPPTLEALLRDSRMAEVRRHLRKPYRDPITGSKTWGIVPAPGGGIMGVFSLAEGRPIKRANFPAELGWAEGAASYADWMFVALPQGQ